MPKVLVPFADLYLQYLGMKESIDSAIADVIRTSSYIRGEYVEEFEKKFASLVSADYCVSCANGTDSLFIAMHALGVKSGDEVITTAHSWISTSESISQAGGNVVFADTTASSYQIDPEQILSKITSKTVGIIPVHLYGQPCDMQRIMEIADEFNLWVIEDCAQAHLATIDDRYVGSFGDIASYSFYPGKNLGAMGDAGALTTNNKNLSDSMAKFARHGGLKKGSHEIEGINSRMDGMQAAVLLAKMPHLRGWTSRRQQIAQIYSEALKEIKSISVPPEIIGTQSVFHLYVIKDKRRDELAKFLIERGIQTSINYPVALPFLPAYKKYGYKSMDFPNAYKNQSQILSLPLYPEMEDWQVNLVIDSLREYGRYS